MHEVTVMRVFGKQWTELDSGTIDELWTLEREGAVYVDLWQDDLKDFRRVRIRFADEETEEYVRSLWAYEAFLRAGSPPSAREVPEIPADIAKRADGYSLTSLNGHDKGPPYHCIAGFIGPHLEALICTNRRSEILEELGTSALLTTVKQAIDSLTPSIRLFNRREKGLAAWPVTREDDVRDLLYAVLRGSVSDLTREEAVPSRAGTHAVVDICSRLARLFIELKWIGQRGQWRQVVKQINDDIQSYVADPRCETIIFVVIDAAKDIPDPGRVPAKPGGPATCSRRIRLAGRHGLKSA